MIFKRRSKQAEKSAITKQRIYECAIELFGEKGFENVTMQDIASYSNTSIGSIYHFFKDKDSIALHMMHQIDLEYIKYITELESSITSKSTNALMKLKKFCLKIQLISVSMGDISLSLMYANGLRHLDQRNLTMDRRELYTILERLINECKAEGFIPPSEDTEKIKRRIIILSRGLLLDWMFSGHSFDLEEESDYMMSLLLKNISHE